MYVHNFDNKKKTEVDVWACDPDGTYDGQVVFDVKNDKGKLYHNITADEARKLGELLIAEANKAQNKKPTSQVFYVATKHYAATSGLEDRFIVPRKTPGLNAEDAALRRVKILALGTDNYVGEALVATNATTDPNSPDVVGKFVWVHDNHRTTVAPA